VEIERKGRVGRGPTSPDVRKGSPHAAVQFRSFSPPWGRVSRLHLSTMGGIGTRVRGRVMPYTSRLFSLILEGGSIHMVEYIRSPAFLLGQRGKALGWMTRLWRQGVWYAGNAFLKVCGEGGGGRGASGPVCIGVSHMGNYPRGSVMALE